MIVRVVDEKYGLIDDFGAESLHLIVHCWWKFNKVIVGCYAVSDGGGGGGSGEAGVTVHFNELKK